MKNILLIGGFVVVLLLLIKKFKTNEPLKKFGTMEEPKYFFKIEKTGNLLNDFVKFIQLKEGGLSRDKSDNAAIYPSPYAIADKSGKVHTDWHTNKGVTYKTFETLSKKLGYTNNAENFKKMPNDIWFKIFSDGYYDDFKDLTSSGLINLYVSTWAWGSGVGGAKSLLKKIGTDLQTMIDKEGEAKTLEFLVKERIKFYERLAKSKSQNEKFLQGWKNSALSFYKNFISYTKN